MPKTALVKRGKEHLPGVQLPEPEEMYGRERPGKSRDRLQAAVLRKQGRMLERIARVMGRGISTARRRLSGMKREGPDGRHDVERPGRPRLLSPEQEKSIEGDLDGTPRDGGFERDIWNAGMVAKRILERFGVPYSRSAIRLAHRLGFPFRKPRPAPRNGAALEGQGPVRKGRATAARWRAGPSWSSTRQPCATRPCRSRGSGAGEGEGSGQPLQAVHSHDRCPRGRRPGSAVP